MYGLRTQVTVRAGVDTNVKRGRPNPNPSINLVLSPAVVTVEPVPLTIEAAVSIPLEPAVVVVSAVALAPEAAVSLALAPAVVTVAPAALDIENEVVGPDLYLNHISLALVASDPGTYLNADDDPNWFIEDENLVDEFALYQERPGPITVDGIEGFTVFSDHVHYQVVNHGQTLHGAQRWKIRGKMDTVPATGKTFGLFGDRGNLYCSIRTYDDPRDGLQHWGMAIDSTPTATWAYVQLFTDAVVDDLPHTFEFDFTLDMLGTVIIIDGVEYPFVGFCGGGDGTVRAAQFPPVEGWWDNASIDAFYGVSGASFLDDSAQDYGSTSDYSNYFDTAGDGNLQSAPDTIGFTIVDIKVYIPLLTATGTVTSGIDASAVEGATVELRDTPVPGAAVGAVLETVVTDAAGTFAFTPLIGVQGLSIAVTSPTPTLMDAVRPAADGANAVVLTDATWTPADLPQCDVWLKADDLATIVDDGSDGVISVQNKAGPEDVWVTPGPATTKTGTQTHNGKNVIEFLGGGPANAQLYSIDTIHEPATWFVASVVNDVEPQSVNRVVGAGIDGYVGWGLMADDVGQRTQQIGLWGIVNSVPNYQVDAAHGQFFVRAFEWTATTIQVYRNGLPDGHQLNESNVDPESFPFVVTIGTPGPIHINCQFNGETYKTQTAEFVLVEDAAVSEADRYRTFDYLNHEWAVF